MIDNATVEVKVEDLLTIYKSMFRQMLEGKQTVKERQVFTKLTDVISENVTIADAMQQSELWSGPTFVPLEYGNVHGAASPEDLANICRMYAIRGDGKCL